MRTIKNRNNDGRPKLPLIEKKSYKITVKFATEEYYSLKAKAREAGVSLSLYVRNAIENSSVKQRLNTTHLEYIRSLTGMANNLNQIAHKANMGGYSNVRGEYLTLAVRVDNLINSIENDG